jgi:hypothetical protein
MEASGFWYAGVSSVETRSTVRCATAKPKTLG